MLAENKHEVALLILNVFSAINVINDLDFCFEADVNVVILLYEYLVNPT